MTYSMHTKYVCIKIKQGLVTSSEMCAQSQSQPLLPTGYPTKNKTKYFKLQPWVNILPNAFSGQIQQDKKFIGAKRVKNCPFSMFF